MAAAWADTSYAFRDFYEFSDDVLIVLDEVLCF